MPQYSYHEDGICFECRGERVKEGVFYNALKYNYNYLNDYNDESKRNDYRNFIKQLPSEWVEIYFHLCYNTDYIFDEGEELPF